MPALNVVTRVGRGLLTANMAAVLRVMFHGSSSLGPRMRNAYRAIDPFDLLGPVSPPIDLEVQRLPEIHLPEVVRQFVPLNMGDGHRFVDGGMPWVDLVALLAIAIDRRPRSMLEIGTYFGYTTRILARSLPDTVIHTVDLPVGFDPQQDSAPIPKDDFHLIENRCVGEAFQNDPSIRNVVQHYADTLTWDFAPASESTLFFIDGSHTYEYVRNDTEKCLAACKDRQATFLWHDCDYAHPGVVRYLSELVQRGLPVKRLGWTHLAIMDY